MRTCAICGKEIDILYPDMWRYKRGDPVHVKAWLCSWKCLRIYDDQKKRKEAEEMARMKKDDTPAAKPGRKPKVEINIAAEDLKAVMEPEAPKVTLVYDESIREECQKEQEAKLAEMAREKLAQVEQPETEVWIPAAEVYGEPEKPAEEKWTVTAIRSDEWGEFYFDEKHRCIDWRHPGGEEISLPLADWVRLPEVIPQILTMLGVG